MSDQNTILELRRALEQARDKMQEQQEYIDNLKAESTSIGICLEVQKTHAFIAVSGTVMRLPHNKLPVKQGTLVIITSATQGMMVTDIITTSILGTRVATFARYTSNRSAIVTIEGEEHRVIAPLSKIETGSRVALDDHLLCIMEDLGLEKKPVTVDMVNILWSQIGGHAAAKQALQEMIEWPHQYKELYKQYGKRPTKGVLLYGPPGCGKTLLAKAAATSISKNGKGMFLYVKGPELLSMWVGEGERQVRDLFARAREGKNATLFIDEADAILGKRGKRGVSTVNDTMVPAFLAEMDGLDAGGPVVILATNRQDALDDAVVREGRIDRKVYVGRPSYADTTSIFTMYLAKTKLQKEAETLASEATFSLFDGKRVLFHCQHSNNTTTSIHLRDVVSGAMIETIVDQARAKAIAEDVAAKRSAASGLAMAHLLASIEDVTESHKHTNNDDVFVAHEERHGKITSIVHAA